MNELTAIEIIALSKAIDAKTLKAAREQLGTGTHIFDTTLRLVGSHDIRADHEAVVAASIPWRDICVHLASKAPRVMVEAALREVLEGQAPKQKKSWVEDFVDGLLTRAKKKVKGAVTGRGAVELVRRDA